MTELASGGMQNESVWIIALASTNIMILFAFVYCMARKRKNQRIAENVEADLGLENQVEGEINVVEE